ncbi:PAS domain-containing hybrid sensor histidine kinase/response regulator [Solidesulfovibrio carbinolicus]|uniref:histidine kinase n=1 Tax=Solidesulfovibrio carbinolicus TaxID=296842 RepID=A0A4P6HL71_9BACT|nr:PAS domain-containing hybrid sensor histidine kinase/response regulator [Solidesulfovibrio carbinolicus]QAZ67927.1 hybrid sensor histidine kinase/response regulator [Solidesulfovibrio carbinolicus]
MSRNGIPPGRRAGVRGWIDLHLYAMAMAALLTGLLLWWTNVSWRENFEAFPPVLEELQQVRVDTVKAYLAVERRMAGEQHVRLPDVDAFFEQAAQGCRDIARAMGQAEPGGEGQAGFQAFFESLDRYAAAIAAFRELSMGGIGALPDMRARLGVERQAAFAALEKQADALSETVRRRMDAGASRQTRLNNILFFAWISFLAFLAGSLAIAGSRRRKAEQAMLASEDKYRSLFDQARDAILVVDDDTGRILDCNRALATEWGYPPETLIGRTTEALGLTNPADDDAPASVLGQNGSLTTIRETRMRTAAGDERLVSVKSGRFRLGEAEVRLDIFRDITDLRREEEALRGREAMLRSLGDNLPDGVIYTLEVDTAGNHRFLYVSQGLERVLGLSVALALADAELVFARIVEDDRERLRQAESQSMATGEPFDVQARVLAPDGGVIWGQFRAAPRPGSGRVVLFDGFYFDVSALKRIEDDLRRAMVVAETASQSKSEFLANISHEIRTPLNGVLGMLQLLETADLGREEAGYVATALKSGRGLTRVLGDILDFSLLEAGAMVIKATPVDVRDVAADVLGALSIECRARGIEAGLVVAPDVPARVLTDGARLRQILFNLVGNAIKFTQAGSVRLDIALASRRGQAVVLLFTVADTGIGMPEDKLDDVFEPFTQVDGSLTRQFGGTGLGLGIVKRLLTLLGGFLAVESRVGVGTRIDFSLPCKLEQASKDAVVKARQAKTPEGPARVLVVEDDAVNRLATVAMLGKMGYTVEAVEDGDLALDVLAARSFDVVLMDIQMPRLSGDEAARRIRQGAHPGVDRHVPVIAVTAHALEGDKERYLACGMNDYLSKPVDVNLLREAVGRALAGRTGIGVA